MRYLLAILLLLAPEILWAAGPEGFVIESRSGQKVSIIKTPEQSPTERFLLIESTASAWGGKLLPVRVNQGTDRIEYISTWKGRDYVVLAGQGNSWISYSLSVEEPYKVYEGLSRREGHDQLDLDKINLLIAKLEK